MCVCSWLRFIQRRRLFLFYFVLRVFLYSLGWPRTQGNPSASAFWVLGLLACATTPGFEGSTGRITVCSAPHLVCTLESREILIPECLIYSFWSLVWYQDFEAAPEWFKWAVRLRVTVLNNKRLHIYKGDLLSCRRQFGRRCRTWGRSVRVGLVCASEAPKGPL